MAYVDSLERENGLLKQKLSELTDKANEKEELVTRLKRVIKSIADML